MLSTLSVVLPIFALILAGWLARRSGVLGPHATAELNRFVVYLALPALLFDIIAHARWVDVWQPGFVAAFGLGTALIFVVTLAIRLHRPRHLADAAIDGLNAGYANTGFIGFPLALVALGREAMAPTLVATIITVCVLFAAAIILIETGLQTEKRRKHLAFKVGRSLLRNPLLVAPVLGALVPLAGLAIPAPVESFSETARRGRLTLRPRRPRSVPGGKAGGFGAGRRIGRPSRRLQARLAASRHLDLRHRRVRPLTTADPRGGPARGPCRPEPAPSCWPSSTAAKPISPPMSSSPLPSHPS